MSGLTPIKDEKLPSTLKGQRGLFVSLANHEAFLGLAGYVFLLDKNLLVVSDLHLEKATSFAKSGQFLPPYDSETTLSRLKEVCHALNPKRVISLGDSFHDENGPFRLGEKSQSLLSEIVEATDWTWIYGNHDKVLPETLGGTILSEKVAAPFHFRHEPTENPTHFEISGHFHPSARIEVKGRRVRKPCFLMGPNRLILPAFGALTGGLDVSDEAFLPFLTEKTKALLIGETKLYPISLLNCV